MGREIRMVPPNWDHPKRLHEFNGEMGDQPMFDRTFDEAAREWLEGLAAWERGDRPDYFSADEHPSDYRFWEYEGGPPDRAFYRPWKDEDATWFQLWETVSEGSPVSPPFATPDELIAYLAENGDFWDQSRARDPRPPFPGEQRQKPGETGWGMERATDFVKAGWAPSLMVRNGIISESKDIPLAMKSDDG